MAASLRGRNELSISPDASCVFLPLSACQAAAAAIPRTQAPTQDDQRTAVLVVDLRMCLSRSDDDGDDAETAAVAGEPRRVTSFDKIAK